jgi:hypothetical protein
MTLNKDNITTMINKASHFELELVWIPKIMRNQTHDEVRDERTEEYNGIGLNGVDATFVTSVFKQIQAGKHLSFKQAESLKKMLPKYWRQYAQARC